MNTALLVKSTIDKELFSLAAAVGLEYVDWDNLATQSKLKSELDNLLIAKFDGVVQSSPNIADGVVRIGVKTVNDSGNYTLLSLLDQVQTKFRPGELLELRDYTQVTASAQLGGLNIRSCHLDENESVAGINLRFVRVDFVAILFGG